MKRKLQRFFGILLSLVLVLSMIPGMCMTVHAETTNVTWDSTILDGIRLASHGETFEDENNEIVVTWMGTVEDYKWEGQDLAVHLDEGYPQFSAYGRPLTKIVINCNSEVNRFFDLEPGWTYSDKQFIWEGSSEEVLFRYYNQRSSGFSISSIEFTYENIDGIRLNKVNVTMREGDVQKLKVATFLGDDEDKRIKWWITEGSIRIDLFEDPACTKKLPLNEAVSNTTVYARGLSAGSASVTVTSNANSSYTSNCVIIVAKPIAVGNIIKNDAWVDFGEEGVTYMFNPLAEYKGTTSGIRQLIYKFNTSKVHSYGLQEGLYTHALYIKDTDSSIPWGIRVTGGDGTDSNPFTFSTIHDSDVKIHTVTLYTNEGTINSGNVTEYVEGLGAALPDNLTRDGYVFDGWFENAECTGEEIKEIFDTDSGDKTYWAKWTALPATAPTVTGADDLTLTYGYDEGSIRVIASAAEGQTITGYQWYSNISDNNSGGTAIEGATSERYTIPTGKNAGTTEYYYCVVTATRTDNNATATSVSDVATVTVKKAANSVVKVPKAYSLKYTGSAQPLVTEGIAEYGTMEYALSGSGKIVPACDEEWSTSIPTGTDANVYYVWFRVGLNENYNGVDPGNIKVVIKKADAPNVANGDASFEKKGVIPDVKGVDLDQLKDQLKEIAEEDETKLGKNERKDVTVTMETKAVTEKAVEVKEASAIKRLARCKTPITDLSSMRISYLNIEVEKNVKVFDVDKNGMSAEEAKSDDTTQLNTLSRVIDIPVKYDQTGVRNLQPVRYHAGKAEAYKKLNTKPTTLEDLTYYVEGSGADTIIHIYTKEISTNALVTSGNKCGIVYHLFCVLTGEHFYTTSYYERMSLLYRFGWIDAGIEWKYPSVPQKDKENTILNPVFWLFNSFTTDYYYMGAFKGNGSF